MKTGLGYRPAAIALTRTAKTVFAMRRTGMRTMGYLCDPAGRRLESPQRIQGGIRYSSLHGARRQLNFPVSIFLKMD